MTETEQIWDTFDSLFKTVHRQSQRVEQLEARVANLEERLKERASHQQSQTQQQPFGMSEMPAERAA